MTHDSINIAELYVASYRFIQNDNSNNPMSGTSITILINIPKNIYKIFGTLVYPPSMFVITLKCRNDIT